MMADEGLWFVFWVTFFSFFLAFSLGTSTLLFKSTLLSRFSSGAIFSVKLLPERLEGRLVFERRLGLVVRYPREALVYSLPALGGNIALPAALTPAVSFGCWFAIIPFFDSGAALLFTVVDD